MRDQEVEYVDGQTALLHMIEGGIINTPESVYWAVHSGVLGWLIIGLDFVPGQAWFPSHFFEQEEVFYIV